MAEFRILGPLDVRRRGEAATFPRTSLRKTLAILLLEAGYAVPMSKLVDALWDDDPPATARRQVQNNAARLRKLLGDPGVVESVGDGYRIVVGEDSLDSLRFGAAVERAREHVEASDPHAALRQLRQALALWRGPALAGMSGRLIESGTQRLDEARLAATEERVDLELRLGLRCEPVIGELRELLSDNPYRQRLTGQLMLSLHRAGRTADALRTYHDFRERLADELGLDPSQQLRELQAALLRDDPDMDRFVAADSPAVARAPAPDTPTPAQLPADTSAFTGRAAELEALDGLLDNSSETAVLCTMAGVGGVGKTALALRWAHRVRDRFPDGQLYVNLHGYGPQQPASPRHVLDGFLRALGQPGDAVPAEVDDAAAMFRSLMSGRRMLVVLDNARELDQVRPLLPGAAGSFTVVTSREWLTGLTARDGAVPIRLDALDQTGARELLANLVGAWRLVAEPDAAERLAELCGGLPLALRIASANLFEQSDASVADFVSELDDCRLDVLAVDGDPDSTAAVVFEQSYRLLEADAQDLFARLGLVPGEDFSRELAIAVAGNPAAEVKRTLNRLESAHLIQQHLSGRYRFHDLIREYARQQARRTMDAAVREEVEDRVVDWYGEQRNSLSSVEYRNLVSAIQAWESHRRSLPLVALLSEYVNLGHSVSEIRELTEAGMRHAEWLGDPEDLYRVYRAASDVYRAAGEPPATREYARKAVEQAERFDEGDADGTAHANLGAGLYLRGEQDEALEMLNTAVRLAEASGSRHQLLAHRANLSRVCRVIGRLADAEEQLRQTVRLSDEMNSDAGAMGSRSSLAILYVDMGRLSDAARLIAEAAGIAERVKSDRFQIITLTWQGEIYRQSGNYVQGKLALSTALALARAVGREALIRGVHNIFAELLSDSGQHRLALDHLDYGDRLSPADLARRRLLMCKIRTRLGEYDLAAELGEQARDVYATSDPLRHARSLAALADAYA
ncbi:MAG: BTAD domain-containing putative transcriptional regulator, partial [Stackebrandtia sp.]